MDTRYGERMGNPLRRLALGAARSRIGAGLVASVLHRFPRVAPGRRIILAELVVLEHPSPMVPGHLLAVSRHGVSDVSATGSRAEDFWTALGDWWDAEGATLTGITNLGARQEVRLLHVHLVPETSPPADIPPVQGETLAGAVAALCRTSPTGLRGVTASVFLSRTETGWQAVLDRPNLTSSRQITNSS